MPLLVFVFSALVYNHVADVSGAAGVLVANVTWSIRNS